MKEEHVHVALDGEVHHQLDRIAAALLRDLGHRLVGAVHVVAMQAITRCGDALGLGQLQRLTVTGPRRSCLLAIYDQEVLGIYADPTKPIGALEKKLETAMRR